MRCKWVLSAAVLMYGLVLIPGPRAADAPTKAGDAPATVIIQVPHPSAKVMIADMPTTLTGEKRRFVSPPLPAGKTFTYSVTAVWEPNNYTKITRKRTVRVQAGKEVVADLREADPRNPDDIVVRYVPTPADVVAAMCKLGKVTKDDVVFDLGCGDGRMVIQAVKDFKAKRGVGIDLDPVRVKESVANAKKAMVSDKVEFRVGDVLKVEDLSSATVVLLYMGTDINLRLRPILQKTLPPGARIVSHYFEMGDWRPTQSETIKGSTGTEYRIHLWTIPPKK